MSAKRDTLDVVNVVCGGIIDEGSIGVIFVRFYAIGMNAIIVDVVEVVFQAFHVRKVMIWVVCI